MPRYAQLVMGPAGSGKSTFCSAVVKHCEAVGRTVRVVNLDPAAEYFDYPVFADVRDLVSVSDVMEDESLQFGPNGGLIFCMEYLANNLDWLDEQLEEFEDDYFLFDCPGQIELYTHIPVMRRLVDHLQAKDFRVCGVFAIDAQFMIEASKFVSGLLSTLSAMITLEIPHVNIMTKLDLLSKKAKSDLDRFLDPDMESLLREEMPESQHGEKFLKLNTAIAHLVDDYGLVHFVPVDHSVETSVGDALLQIDMSIQYGEDLETKMNFKDEEDPEE